ncbi:hypothetical protein E2562_015295 [Oryza meyeriana var. granulata]|uniref:Protein kinase domain-containing protein n=1 Tax=Oryza meyeriana var. granulata TaxID=110450 RepID=A0A6G1DJP3_9ORYZ|nr:hypothetical protein E2562_015295 [Oryza meyeriana var. granulata]
MERHHLCFIAVVLAFQLAGGQAATDATARARFSCNVSTPCDTFVVYRTQSPGFLDLGNISDLFGVSRALIASANKLTTEDGQLLPGQPLLVPIKCGCTGTRSFANVTYPIRPGDTFYGLAVTAFENLTDFGLVEELNPAAEPTKLQPWQEVVVPLFCRCPTREELSAGSWLLVTYVWQPGDDMSVVSTLMNASAANIAASNGVAGNSTFAMGQPVLIPVSQRPRLPPLLYGAIAADSRVSKRQRGIIVAASIAGSFVACAALCTAILVYRRYGKNKALVPKLVSPKISWTKSLNRFDSNSSIARMINGGDKLLTSVSQFIDKPIIFREEEIMEATMNLDEQCKIGSSYYRAKLEGEVFVVKPVKGNVSGELRMMQMVNHANLIKLAGISIGADGDYAFLVYEFAEKGSLDKWLYQKPSCSLPSSSSVTTLSWDQRLGIALDVANGLLYMHEHTQPSMVHGDVRARNILLTAGFRAKLSNFSLAKPATVDAAATSSDVFAFGLILLELLSGRRAVEARVGAEIGMLWMEIRAVLDAGGDKRAAKLKRWMDPALGGEYGMDAALSLAGMARACTEEDAARRPKMAEIAFSLSVLGQPLSVADAFEKLWQPSSEDSIKIGNAVAAR